MRGKQVIRAEEHAQKIAASRDASGDKDFFFVARTNACENKSDNLGGQSEDNIIMNQKEELFTEMIKKHRNRISYISLRNPQLMSYAEEENDDQRQPVSFLNQDLAMEGEEEVEDASVAEFASRDIVSFSSSQYTALEDINFGNHDKIAAKLDATAIVAAAIAAA